MQYMDCIKGQCFGVQELGGSHQRISTIFSPILLGLKDSETRRQAFYYPRSTGLMIYFCGIMNPASELMWASEINLKILLSCYVSGFPMDCVHAATCLFLWLAAEPMLQKLDRIKIKYGLIER